MLNSPLSNETSFDHVQDGITLAHAIVDTFRDPLLVLDQDLRIVAASRSFYQTFQLVREDVRGHLLYEIDGGRWNLPELRAVLEAIAKDHAPIEGYEVDRVFPVIGQRIMLLNARKIIYETGDHTSVLLVFEDITGRREVERQIQNLMREKDMLLEEMQHRVANSLQIIASILLIKARTVQSEETRMQLQDAHRRVLSVAAVQQHLHSSSQNEQIEIAGYLSKLCRTLAESMIGDSRPISLKVVADAGTAPSRQAVSIGLIVTELVMNALKHAFQGATRNGAIVVSYSVAGPDWKLTVSDNGVGPPETGVDRNNSDRGGLGTSLIQALAKQLEARVDTVSGSKGTAVSVTHATFKYQATESGGAAVVVTGRAGIAVQ